VLTGHEIVLFQGDSITDCQRSRSATTPNERAGLGFGYASRIVARLREAGRAADLRFHNRGVSGDRVPDLAARWQEDCLDLQPDVLSILVGVNDMWHGLQGSYADTPESFEQGYRELLARTRAALPAVKLIICEPFVVRCGAVDGQWFPEFDNRRVAVRRLAGEFDAAFVGFQSAFDRAVEGTSPADWCDDGVHPTFAGHEMMADVWLEAVVPEMRK